MVVGIPTNIFPTAVSLPAVGAGIVEAKVTAYLHPSVFQWASDNNKRAQHIGGQPPLAIQWHLAGSIRLDVGD